MALLQQLMRMGNVKSKLLTTKLTHNHLTQRDYCYVWCDVNKIWHAKRYDMSKKKKFNVSFDSDILLYETGSHYWSIITLSQL